MPTRELAAQVQAVLSPLAHAMGLSTTAIFGGISQNPQVAALRDRADSTDVVALFDGPLTVVVGDRDELLPVEEARQIAESAPEGRLEVVEGAGHLVNLDAPERFNEILRELLERAPR